MEKFALLKYVELMKNLTRKNLMSPNSQSMEFVNREICHSDFSSEQICPDKRDTTVLTVNKF